jgi:hypothetical protein
MLSIYAASSVEQSRHTGVIVTRLRRLLIALGIVAAVLAALAFAPARVHASGPIGVKSHYLALGDSLAFGYEPNLNWSHGYAQQ